MSALSRRSRLAMVGAVLAALVTGTITGTAESAVAATSSHSPRPTVVLVHGAWADSSSWDGVVRRLLHDGYPVDVFPTPLRSLSGDADQLRTYLAAITGPVVLVGHSYGGAVVTGAATGNTAVTALVYVDAFAPAAGEAVLTLPGPGSVLANPDPTQVFDLVPAGPPTATTDLYVKKSVFPSAFANDVPAREAKLLAVTQRPVTLGALMEPSGDPAWLTIPSWYEVGTIDRVIPADVQTAMATRAHSHITRVRTGHLPMVSDPRAVTRVIESAAAATVH